MTGTIVGRSGELARLRRALDAALDEDPRLVLLAGEAGVGKSTLLGAGLDLARSLGFATVVGACADGDTGSTFTPIRAAFRSLPGLYEDAFPNLPGRHPAARGLLDPAAAAPGDPLDLAQAALDLLGELTEHQPLVVAVEDLHWADRSTLALLSFLARNVAGERLVLLGTARTDELDLGGPAAQMIVECSRLARVDRVDLGGLGLGELRLLVEGLGTGPVGDGELRVLEQRSGGNPFFAVELAAAGITAATLPPSIRDVLALRLARLSDSVQPVVHAASVAGAVVDAELVARVLDAPVADVERALRSAIDAGVLAVDPVTGEVQFRHALLREVAYAGLFASERTRLHAAVADALATADAAVLAHHFQRAGRLGEALRAHVDAARAAAASSGSSDALAHYAQVASLWDGVPDAEALVGSALADLLYEAVDYAIGVGEIDDGLPLGELLLARTDPEEDPERWALTAARVSELRWETGDVRDAADLLRRAAAALDASRPSEARVRVLERQAFHTVVGQLDAAGAAIADEALAVARELDDPELLSLALNRVGLTRVALGVAGGGRHQREAFDVAVAAGLPHEVVRSAVNIMMINQVGGRYDTVRRTGEEASIACDRFGASAPFRAVVDALHARGLVAQGEWDRAADLLAGISMPRALRFRSYIAAARAELAVARGDHVTARAELDEIRFSNVMLLTLVRDVGDAEDAFNRGDRDAARATIGATLDVTLFFPSTTALLLTALLLDAGIDDPDRRLAVAEEKAGWLRQLPDPPGDVDAWIARVRAAHADATGAASAARWADAVSAFAALGMPVRRAECEVRQAAALLASAAGADRSLAARLVTRAHAVAVHVGAAPLRRAAEDLGRRARLDVPGISLVSSTDDLGLTEREAEVLRLVALGRTNREVAGALFISPKTASVHVSNILRKVGAATRGEAAALAHRHGLVPSGS